jgi:hypothetical protein
MALGERIPEGLKKRNEGSKHILYEMPGVIPYRMPDKISGISYGITGSILYEMTA